MDSDGFEIGAGWDAGAIFDDDAIGIIAPQSSGSSAPPTARAAAGESQATANLSMGGGDNFGFVTSAPELDILELSRFIEADRRVREVNPLSQDVVLGKVEAVLAGLEAHAKATGNQAGGEVICGLFRKAMWRTLKENEEIIAIPDGEVSVAQFKRALRRGEVNREEAAYRIRQAAIRAYTIGAVEHRDDLGYLYTTMNEALRKITRITSLKDTAIRGAAQVALDECGLWPYADLLIDAIRKLRPLSGQSVTLFRRQQLDEGALEHLQKQKNSVISFTTFTSFTDSRQRLEDYPGNVVWKLRSSQRMKVGKLSEFPREEECLLPPGSAVQIVGVSKEGDRTVIEARDLPLVRQTEKVLTGSSLLEVPAEAELALQGGENFGFVTSEAALDILRLSRLADADELMRRTGAVPVDGVLKKVDEAIEGLERHAKATGNEAGGEIICELFRNAKAEARSAGPSAFQKVREAAIRSYALPADDTKYLLRDLNAGLQKVTGFAALKDAAVRQAIGAVLGDLSPYADLLVDALKKPGAASDGALNLFRGQHLGQEPLRCLRERVGAVIAFTGFTSFSDQEAAAIEYVLRTEDAPGQARVLWKLESSGRRKIGGFAESPGEEEYLLPPGSAAQVVGIEERDGLTVVRLRDLPLVKKAKRLPDRMQSTDVPPALRPGVEPLVGKTTILHREVGRGNAGAVAQLAENCPELVNAQDEEGRTPLWVASKKGDAAIVTALLIAGANPRLSVNDGTSPMHVAAGEGHLEVLQALHAHGVGFEDEKANGETPIFEATRAKLGRVIAWLQVNGADVNRARKDGRTPLFVAAEGNLLPIAMTLATLGAKLNALDVNKWTPTIVAASKGHLPIVQMLGSLGADVNVRTSDGFAAIHAAAQNGSVEVVKSLVWRGADAKAPNKSGATPLWIAAREGHVEVVKALFWLGADVRAANKELSSPVHVAAQEGHVEVVKALAWFGADVNVRDRDGVTPACIAAREGHVEVVKALASAGADVKAPTNGGATPTYFAAWKGHLRLVKVLASLGADVNVPNNFGATPVYIAAQEGHVEVVKVLAALGADVNVPPRFGATPIYIATRDGHVEVVRALVSLGGDVNVPDSDGVTPVYVAAQEGNLEVMKVLVGEGANVNAPKSGGRTPLMTAAAKGDAGVVAFLLQSGADPLAQLPSGDTACDIARFWGHDEIVAMLQEA